MSKTNFFKIYLDRLKDGHVEELNDKISSDFMEIADPDLSFPEEVAFSGEAYLSDGFLILQLKIQTVALLPCLICNEKVKLPIFVDDFCLSEKISEFRHQIFDFTDEVRSSIIVKIPQYFECSKGRCPEREAITKFLKN